VIEFFKYFKRKKGGVKMDKLWRYFQNLNGIERKLKNPNISEGKREKLLFLKKKISKKIEKMLLEDSTLIEKID